MMRIPLAIILLSAVLGFSVQQGFGQNLEFSRVLLLDTDFNGTDSLGTVPAGKVWKISAAGSEASGGSSCAFSFNGGTRTAFRVGGVSKLNSGYDFRGSEDEIWLPVGTPIHALSCGSRYRWLSIIEFNIVP
jgi:hypothetical protein